MRLCTCCGGSGYHYRKRHGTIYPVLPLSQHLLVTKAQLKALNSPKKLGLGQRSIHQGEAL